MKKFYYLFCILFNFILINPVFADWVGDPTTGYWYKLEDSDVSNIKVEGSGSKNDAYKSGVANNGDTYYYATGKYWILPKNNSVNMLAVFAFDNNGYLITNSTENINGYTYKIDNNGYLCKDNGTPISAGSKTSRSSSSTDTGGIKKILDAMKQNPPTTYTLGGNGTYSFTYENEAQTFRDDCSGFISCFIYYYNKYFLNAQLFSNVIRGITTENMSNILTDTGFANNISNAIANNSVSLQQGDIILANANHTGDSYGHVLIVYESLGNNNYTLMHWSGQGPTWSTKCVVRDVTILPNTSSGEGVILKKGPQGNPGIAFELNSQSRNIKKYTYPCILRPKPSR